MPRLPSTDGVTLAVHDLGGDGPPLLMAHATGFCGPVLAPLAALLADRFHCWTYDARGHGDTETPSGLDWNWSSFADDALAVVDGLGLELPYGFGHSSGGAALLGAEARRPGTFVALWCFEPIVWPEITEELVASRRPLISGALKRRDQFASREEAYENFSSKPPLESLDAKALRAYVDCGFAPAKDGVRLKCPPFVEASIYRQGLRHDGFSRLADVRCPVTIAHGGRSMAMGPSVPRAQVDALPDASLVTFPDLGHFGPLEDLGGVATRILETVAPPR
ncbi:MAG TPA: alpha/beta hydrolase [Acidimicrobiales bacterium]|nr:alpha/beta hydrolase [Acidimicrobiales bacterium]